MSRMTGPRPDRRERLGTILMVAALVFFVAAMVNPLPDGTSAVTEIAYYGAAATTLGVGWWLRRTD